MVCSKMSAFSRWMPYTNFTTRLTTGIVQYDSVQEFSKWIDFTLYIDYTNVAMGCHAKAEYIRQRPDIHGRNQIHTPAFWKIHGWNKIYMAKVRYTCQPLSKNMASKYYEYLNDWELSTATWPPWVWWLESNIAPKYQFCEVVSWPWSDQAQQRISSRHNI